MIGCLGSNEVSPQTMCGFGVPGVERSEPPDRDHFGFAGLNPSHPTLVFVEPAGTWANLEQDTKFVS
jgi:hypothetical protein